MRQFSLHQSSILPRQVKDLGGSVRVKVEVTFNQNLRTSDADETHHVVYKSFPKCQTKRP